MQKLHTFYISNNKIRSWDEVGKCSQLAELRNVLFFGNPVYDTSSKQVNWPMVLARINQLENIDGTMISFETRQAAQEIEL